MNPSKEERIRIANQKREEEHAAKVARAMYLTQFANRISSGAMSLEELLSEKTLRDVFSLTNPLLNSITPVIDEVSSQFDGFDDITALWLSAPLAEISTDRDPRAIAWPKIVFVNFWRRIANIAPGINDNGFRAQMKRIELFHRVYAGHVLSLFAEPMPE